MSNPPTEACSLKQTRLVTLGDRGSIGTTLSADAIGCVHLSLKYMLGGYCPLPNTGRVAYLCGLWLRPQG